MGKAVGRISRIRVGLLDKTRDLKSLSRFSSKKIDLEGVELDGFNTELRL